MLAAGERVELEFQSVLARTGEPVTRVHFPETAVISMVSTYSDGSIIEMANVGREAFTGVNLMLGEPLGLATYEVQISGSALEMPTERFVALKSEFPELDEILLATVRAVHFQVMVSGACNGVHGSRQRLARWLLTMQDRIDDERMSLTQDFLGQMLAVRRATVSEIASKLRDEGLIAYDRGSIRITDRPGLERASCECYKRVRSAYDVLLPPKD